MTPGEFHGFQCNVEVARPYSEDVEVAAMHRFSTLTLALVALTLSTAAAPPEAKPGERTPLQFSQSPPQIEAEQLRMRLHSVEVPGPYDVTKETFEVLVPKDYKPTVPHGLFIWVSPGNTPAIPKEWEPVLAEKKLIFIGARNSGNPRDIFDRVRMAVDANVNLRSLFNVDGRRVYVSGFSGGGRVASMLGVAYAEMFSGSLCFMGVNFYNDTAAPDGKLYGANYVPDDQVLALAKKFCRYVLVTGTKDMNHANTHGVYENGFKKEGFTNVKLMDIPGQGHSPPGAEWLRKGIELLDEGKAEK